MLSKRGTSYEQFLSLRLICLSHQKYEKAVFVSSPHARTQVPVDLFWDKFVVADTKVVRRYSILIGIFHYFSWVVANVGTKVTFI